ncbi:MAG TPA: allophycocyanin subunit beta, partial [Candidatus Sericytochromatia bacterium]
VPIGPTVMGIQIMKGIVKEQVAAAGILDTGFVDQPFDHMTRELSEQDI